MNKIYARIALVLLLLPGVSLALGVGEIEVMSALNEPLEAEIELIYSDSSEAEATEVRLADPEDFDRIGLDRGLLGIDIRFAVVRNDQGNFVIRATTPEPVTEPFLDILIEVEWETGRLLREYVILLDPPVSAPTAAPDISPAPAPAESPVTRAPVRETPTQRGTVRGTGSGQTYGPVARGDTLWEIARDWRPSSDVSINEMMVMLLQMNPDAFFQDNVNALRAGAILRLPGESDFAAADTGSADLEVARQNRSWNDYVASVGGRQVPTVSDAGAEAEYTAASPSDPRPADDSRLELVPPAGESTAGVDRPGDARAQAELADMRQELARAREDLISARQENTDLTDRVQELEDLVASMERAISLKDASLADLQAQLRESRDAGPGDTTQDLAATDTSDFGVEPDTATPAPDSTPDPFEVTREPVEDVTTEPADVGEPEDQVAAGAVPEQQAPEPTVTRPERPERSMLANPLVWGGALVLIAALGGAGFFVYRRRQAAGEGDFAVLETADADEAAAYEEEAYAEEAYAEDEAPEYEPEPAPPADEIDTSDADDDAAMVAAVEENPNDPQAHLALLRRHYAAEDRDQFMAAAEKMHEHVGVSHPAWMEVKAMGANLAPGSALFGEEPDTELDFDLDSAGESDEVAATAVMQAPTGEVDLEEDADQETDEDDSLDLDFDLEDDEPEEPAVTGDDLDESIDLDLDLDEDLTEDAEPAAGAEAADESLDLDLDLDDDLGGDLDLDEDLEEEAGAADASVEAAADELDDLDLDLDDTDDETTQPEAEPATAEDEDALDDLALDLDLDDLDDTDAEEDLDLDLGLDTEEMAPAEVEESDDDTQFDLDAFEEDSEAASGSGDRAEMDTAELPELDLEVADAEDEATAEGAAEVEDVDAGLDDLGLEDLDLGEEDITGGEDAAGTKLDLARAYIDMGDPDGARGMLEEVLAEGNDEQKEEARKLIDDLQD